MDVQDGIRAHYSGTGLADLVMASVRETSSDPERIGVEDLAGFDQLHAGFLPATRHLHAALGVSGSTRLLDVGCGIGGAVRVAAHDHGCAVVGADLSPDFVDSARRLSEAVGIDALTTYVLADGATLPFSDGSFDAATLIHVGMNVPDKAVVFREVHRVLVPGGRFGVYDQMRVGDGPLGYPMPWAVDETTSFVETPDAYVAALESSGFTITDVEDRTRAVAGPPPGVGPPGGPGLPIAVFGPEFPLRIQNNVAATRGGLLGAIQILTRA